MKENSFTKFVDFLLRFKDLTTPDDYSRREFEKFMEHESSVCVSFLKIEKDITGGLGTAYDFQRKMILDLIPVIDKIRTKKDIADFLRRDDVRFLCPEILLHDA